MAVIGFNTRELEAMEEAFRKMTNNSSLLRKCTVRLSQRMLRSAKMRSPVKTGELRRNWNITCERKGRGYVITLSNPKKYAPYVEYGHRTRNHTGWVKGYFPGENAIRASIKVLPRIVEEEMRRGLGN